MKPSAKSKEPPKTKKPLFGRWRVITIPFAQMKPAPYNPREMTPKAQAALERSLQRFGLVDTIVWNKRTGHIVGGHKRVAILQTHGETEAPVVEVDLDPVEEKALNLTLNNPYAQGDFTANTEVILEELKAILPDAYDSLMLFELDQQRQAIPSAGGGYDEADQDLLQPEFNLNPDPYESYHYVVLLFKNELEWSRAMDHFQVQPTSHSYAGKKTYKKIGQGRALDGSAYLDKIQSK